MPQLYSFSKDGIANMLSDYNIATLLLARLVGLFDTIFTVIALPLAILCYLTLMIIGTVSWMLLWPFALLCPSPAFKVYMTAVGIFALCAIPSICVTIVLAILTPFQILVPELTVFVFQIHKWSRAE